MWSLAQKSCSKSMLLKEVNDYISKTLEFNDDPV
jgi:hypothetical protein